MELGVQDLVNGLAKELVRLEERHQNQNHGWQGIGGLAEKEILSEIRSLAEGGLSQELFGAVPLAFVPAHEKCDLLIPGEWAVELNLVRMPEAPSPKGSTEEFETGYGIPLYADASNPLGDCLKLTHSPLPEKKAMLLFGFTPDPEGEGLLTGVKALEVVADYVLAIRLGERHHAGSGRLAHPHFQYAQVFGWEVEAIRQVRQSVQGRPPAPAAARP